MFSIFSAVRNISGFKTVFTDTFMFTFLVFLNVLTNQKTADFTLFNYHHWNESFCVFRGILEKMNTARIIIKVHNVESNIMTQVLQICPKNTKIN